MKNRVLYYILAIIGIVLSSKTPLRAENLISDRIMQGSAQYDFTNTFSVPEPLRFSLVDNAISGDWQLSLKSRDGVPVAVPFEVEDCACVFTPSEVKFDIWERQASRNFNKSYNRYEFVLDVSFTSESGQKEERTVSLAFLPEMPIISNIEYIIYSYDWEYDQIYPDGTFSFDVESKGAEEFWLRITDSFLYNPSFLFFSKIEEVYTVKDKAHVSYGADWGEYVTISVKNDYGFVRSDTLYTTDYIFDEKILNRIHELTTGIDDLQSEEITYFWDNCVLRFSGSPKDLKIYSVNGECIYTSDIDNEIDLSFLARGVYVLSYFDDRNRKYTHHKILRK